MRSTPCPPKPTRCSASVCLAAMLAVLALSACHDQPTEPRPSNPAFSSHATGPVVNSAADPGDGTCDAAECTLREAIAAAEAGHEITFHPDLVGSTILLDGTQLLLVRDVTITGPGADDLIIDGGAAEVILEVDAGVNAQVTGLALTGAEGSAVWNRGTLTLERCVIRDVIGSHTSLISNTGGSVFVLRHCAVEQNFTEAIFSNFGSATIDASTVAGNDSDFPVIANSGTQFIIRNSTISGNRTTTSIVGASGTSPGLSVDIQNSTMVGNTSSFATIRVAELSISTSLVAGNITKAGGECDAPSVTSSGDNLVGPSDFCTFAPGDQEVASGDVFTRVLAPLADNGGPTWTHALLDPADTGTDNPALDAGNCAATGVTEDQRGIARPQDVAGIPNTHDGCDIGAFELQSDTPPPCTLAELGAKVETLQADGVLNAGQAKGLLRKLDQFERLLSRGKTGDAQEVLADFVRQVDDLESMGVLSEEQADDLRGCAADVAPGSA